MAEVDTRVFAIYSRKSKFTGKGESIENQIEMCRNYIAAQYGTEQAKAAVVYEDEGYSGKNTKRPQFQKMMQAVKRGKIRSIVCYRLDRVTRSVGDCAALVDELDLHNTQFVSLKENFDLATPIGRAMFNIVVTFAQLERETIAERIRDNLHELAKTGRWLGGITPTGYTSTGEVKITVDRKKKKAYHLQLIPEEAQTVKTIFQKFLEFKSLTKLETYLLNAGYKTKNEKDFTRYAIRGILTNPVYAKADVDTYDYLVDCGVNLFSEEADFDGTHGIMAYNRTDQQAGRKTRIKPMTEWVVSVGKHDGLVSGEDWIAVQELLEENRTKGRKWRAGRVNKALLSGLLYCKCGDYMRPKLSERKTADGERHYTYRCALKEKSRSHKCTVKDINGNQLDSAVCYEIKKLAEDDSEFIRQLKAGKRYITGDDDQLSEDLIRLGKEKQETEKEANALVGTLAKVAGTQAEQRIVDRINQLEEKAARLQNKIENLECTLRAKDLYAQEFDVLRGMLKSFAMSVDDATVEQKRILLRTLVKRIVWDGEQIHIYLFGDNDPDGGDNIDFPPPEGADGESADANSCKPFCEDSK